MIGKIVEYMHRHYDSHTMKVKTTIERGVVIRENAYRVGIENRIEPYSSSNPPVLWRFKDNVKIIEEDN